MKQVWKVVIRYEAEETVYVTADANWAARMVAQGGEEEYGEILGATETDVVGKMRAKKATRVSEDDVPEWVLADNRDVFNGS